MISKNEFPQDWKTVELGDICTVTYGDSLPTRERNDGEIPVYGSGGISGYHNDDLSHGPAIILGRKGSINNVNYVDSPFWAIDTTYYLEIVDKSRISLRYVYYFLKSFDLEQLNKAAAVPSLRKSDLVKIKIPVPSHEEQERIVSALDDAFESLDRVSELSQQIRDRGDELIGAISYRQFGTDDLPDEWEICELSEAVEYKSNLTTPKDTPDREFTLLDLEDVEPHTGRITGTKTVAGSEIGSSKRNFGSDDILYCKLRPYLNKVVCPDFEGVASSELLALEPKEGFLKEYVAYFLRSPAVWQRAESLMKGANHPRINKGDLLSFAIPKPPLEEQERIVALLDGLTGVTGRSISSATQIADYAGELRGSLLQQAFTGQLLRD